MPTEKKRVLYLHGFLGNSEDMKPFFIEGFECHSVNLKNYMKNKSDILKAFKGPYDLALGYSYGGRVLGKLIEESPDYVANPIFISTRLSSYTEQELKEREVFKNKLLNFSLNEFYDYWENLSLFDGHSMDEYRKKHNLPDAKWSLEDIHYYLKNEFTFENQVDCEKLKDRALYLYGESDSKYKNEAKKMPFVSKAFKGGHRFLFDQIDAVKNELKAD